MGLLGLALVLVIVWALLVGAVHVTAAVVHILIIAAVVLLVVWLFRTAAGGPS